MKEEDLSHIKFVKCFHCDDEIPEELGREVCHRCEAEADRIAAWNLREDMYRFNGDRPIRDLR